jgi:type I restriction enzyme, S subunit
VRYRHYPAYKDSGIEWLKEIPIQWKVGTLSSLFINNKNKNSNLLNKNLLSLSYGKIIRKDIDANKGLLPQNFSSYQIVRAGYIVLRLTDLQNDKKSLRTGFVHEDGIITSAYVGLAKKSASIGIEKYFHLYLHTFDVYKGFYGMGAGVRQGLGFDELKKLRVLLPPHNEQQAISTYVDNAISKIDILIVKQTKLKELLKEKRQTTVDVITHKENTRHLRICWVVNRVFRPVSRSAKKHYTALGLYNRGRGLFHKPLKNGSELGDSDFYWILESDLILSGQFAWEGSVAIASHNENNCIVSHRYPVIRGIHGVIETQYLWAYLTTRAGDFLLNEHSVGSAGRNRPLNMNTLMKAVIPVPTIEEQVKVAKMVETEEKLKILIDKSIDLLKEKRTALICSAVTGKIDVREAV